MLARHQRYQPPERASLSLLFPSRPRPAPPPLNGRDHLNSIDRLSHIEPLTETDLLLVLRRVVYPVRSFTRPLQARELGLAYQTMAHKLRHGTSAGPVRQLHGFLKADETFMGSRSNSTSRAVAPLTRPEPGRRRRRESAGVE